MKIIDLTHTFTVDMPVFPGDPSPILEQVAFVEKDTFTDHKLTSVMHVGTHMDAPLHMIAGGKKIDEIPVDRSIGKGVLVDARGKDKIDARILENISLMEGDIVLVFTGVSSKYRTSEYYSQYPEITDDFANEMVKRKVHMLGMDMPGPDHDNPWTTHKILLGNNISILENLTNLEHLLGIKYFEIIALPMKIQASGAPVRVIARI